jgi:flagellar basal body-associated protein FliL
MMAEEVGMTWIVLGIVAAALAVAVGLLIFWLARRAQTAVPRLADSTAERRERIVGEDAQGRPVTDAPEGAPPARDAAAFEHVLQEELDDRGR